MATQPTALETYLQRLPIILDKIEARYGMCPLRRTTRGDAFEVGKR